MRVITLPWAAWEALAVTLPPKELWMVMVRVVVVEPPEEEPPEELPPEELPPEEPPWSTWV